MGGPRGTVDHSAGQTRIAASFKADQAGCAPFAGDIKDICAEVAKAKEQVASAELEYACTGKTADQNEVLVVKTKSTCAVAQERCDDSAGNAKDVCVKEARAAEAKALADAKLGRKVGAAKADALDTKRDADCELATEKCDALAGDARSACVATARTTYGQR